MAGRDTAKAKEVGANRREDRQRANKAGEVW